MIASDKVFDLFREFWKCVVLQGTIQTASSKRSFLSDWIFPVEKGSTAGTEHIHWAKIMFLHIVSGSTEGEGKEVFRHIHYFILLMGVDFGRGAGGSTCRGDYFEERATVTFQCKPMVFRTSQKGQKRR
jgi:hypothetical protein